MFYRQHHIGREHISQEEIERNRLKVSNYQKALQEQIELVKKRKQQEREKKRLQDQEEDRKIQLYRQQIGQRDQTQNQPYSTQKFHEKENWKYQNQNNHNRVNLPANSKSGIAFLNSNNPQNFRQKKLYMERDSLDAFIKSEKQGGGRSHVLRDNNRNANQLIINNKNLQSSFNLFASPVQRKFGNAGNQIEEAPTNFQNNRNYEYSKENVVKKTEHSDAENDDKSWVNKSKTRFKKFESFGNSDNNHGFQARIGHLNR